MLAEIDIKLAILQRLAAKGASDGPVFANEMVTARGKRRADFVVIGNGLHAFEIKSDLDSLYRLQGQIHSYLERFDKLTLVVVPKFTVHALQADEKIAVWEVAQKKNGLPAIKVVRRGKQTKVKDKRVLSEFFSKKDMLRIVGKYNKKSCLREMTRDELEELIQGLSVNQVREAVLETLKAKYNETTKYLLEGEKMHVSSQDLKLLSVSKMNRHKMELSYGSAREKEERKRRSINLSRLLPEGDIPKSIPQHILIPEV